MGDTQIDQMLDRLEVDLRDFVTEMVRAATGWLIEDEEGGSL